MDWELLGRSACDGDGTSFFDDALRERVIDTGLRFAEDVATALRGSRGRSLYLGAEVAELPVMLMEHVVLERRVEWLNVDGHATRELARAIDAVSAALGVALPSPRTCSLRDLERADFDHLWMVSVLTDPDAFPALHDELYERAGGPLATGRGDLADDRRRAEALVDDLLDRASASCVLSTTEEELAIVAPCVERRGWKLEIAGGGRLTAIVGDRVRIGRLTRARVE